jgi:hypothetical protein
MCAGLFRKVFRQKNRKPLIKFCKGTSSGACFFQFSIGRDFEGIEDAWALAMKIAQDRRSLFDASR